MITRKELNHLLDPKQPLLTREDEVEVFKYYEAHHDNDIRNLILLKNTGLVNSVLSKFYYSGFPADDLRQEGMFGLMRAIDAFDYRQGNKFSTYAMWWIKQAIQRHIDCNCTSIRIPVHIREKSKKIRKYIAKYQAEYNKEPDLVTIAKEMKMSPDKVAEIIETSLASSPASLNAKVGEEGESELYDFVIDPNTSGDIEAAMRDIDLAKFVETVKGIVSEKEFKVLTMRFGLDGNPPMTLEEIGTVMNVTRERIRQIQVKALRKITAPYNMRKLEDYREYLKD